MMIAMYNKKEIMCNAHKKYKQGCYRNLAEALRHAWFEAKLQDYFVTDRRNKLC